MKKRLTKMAALLCCASMTFSYIPTVYAENTGTISGWYKDNGSWYYYEI